MLSFKEYLKEQLLHENKTINIVDVITVADFLEIVKNNQPNAEMALVVVSNPTPLKVKYSSAYASTLYYQLNDSGVFLDKVVPGTPKQSFVKMMTYYSKVGTNMVIVSDTQQKANAIAKYLIDSKMAVGKITGTVDKEVLSALLE